MPGLPRWWTFRRLVIAALAIGVPLSAGAWGASWWISSAADGRVYTVADVPTRPVVMVLGAQVYPETGEPSPFLAARLDLARQIYTDGKAQAILVSGDNGQVEYNEVDPMRAWLIDRGIPDTDVVGDYAGFDTYDSYVRAKKVFGVTSMIVVTQSFHVERAIVLCHNAGIDAIGVGDDTVRRYPVAWRKAAAREYGADLKAAWDTWWNRDPIFLGPRESGIDTALRS